MFSFLVNQRLLNGIKDMPLFLKGFLMVLFFPKINKTINFIYISL